MWTGPSHRSHKCAVELLVLQWIYRWNLKEIVKVKNGSFTLGRHCVFFTWAVNFSLKPLAIQSMNFINKITPDIRSKHNLWNSTGLYKKCGEVRRYSPNILVPQLPYRLNLCTTLTFWALFRLLNSSSQQTYVQNRTRFAKVASYETSQETSVSCTQLVVLYAPFQFGSEYHFLVWKSTKNYARMWYQNLCRVLFDVTFVSEKIWHGRHSVRAQLLIVQVPSSNIQGPIT